MEPISLDDKHLIIREAFRHYIDFYDYWKREGRHTIEFKGLTISFLDLKRVLSAVDLSDRKAQAFVLNVLKDKKQKEVAEIMGITTVSVGQYVNAACRQFSELYWTTQEQEISEATFGRREDMPHPEKIELLPKEEKVEKPQLIRATRKEGDRVITIYEDYTRDDYVEDWGERAFRGDSSIKGILSRTIPMGKPED